MHFSPSRYPIYYGDDLGVSVLKQSTRFRIWSPCAEGAVVTVYSSPTLGDIYLSLPMNRSVDGTWITSIPENLVGKYYTFRICHNGKWLNETPGPWAKAVSCNGIRGAIVELSSSNPPGWENDKGPNLNSPTDAVIYEMHHRDISAHFTSGIVNKGKFIAITEDGTLSPEGESTGIDHISQLGVTHVQLMPSFDFKSVDENSPTSLQYNWGYDPSNYNVPEGSYSTDTADPTARIKQMKQMIMSFHRRGIGVIMDVVYNHTADISSSAFSLTAPEYFYRYRSDGTPGNASGCGNETASEREQMRLFIVKSVAFWMKEYHIDGFRFDLMGVHDIATMNVVAREARSINPNAMIYGEGWTADASVLSEDKRAVKKNLAQLDRIAVFSDVFRDAIKGSYAKSEDKGFISGKTDSYTVNALKAGIVAFTSHQQVAEWMEANMIPPAPSPECMVNYVSCHDNLTLTDKIAASIPSSVKSLRCRTARLAQTIIFTSQGIPFLFAGEEIFRDKKGDENSYRSSDAVNAIDWRLKSANKGQFEYYCNLIKLRRLHPAFRLRTTDDIKRHIRFDSGYPSNIISYNIREHAGGDIWEDIRVIFNGGSKGARVRIPKGTWIVIAEDGRINPDGIRISKGGLLTVAAVSAMILAR